MQILADDRITGPVDDRCKPCARIGGVGPLESRRRPCAPRLGGVGGAGAGCTPAAALSSGCDMTGRTSNRERERATSNSAGASPLEPAICAPSEELLHHPGASPKRFMLRPNQDMCVSIAHDKPLRSGFRLSTLASGSAKQSLSRSRPCLPLVAGESSMGSFGEPRRREWRKTPISAPPPPGRPAINQLRDIRALAAIVNARLCPEAMTMFFDSSVRSNWPQHG